MSGCRYGPCTLPRSEIETVFRVDAGSGTRTFPRSEIVTVLRVDAGRGYTYITKIRDRNCLTSRCRYGTRTLPRSEIVTVLRVDAGRGTRTLSRNTNYNHTVSYG